MPVTSLGTLPLLSVSCHTARLVPEADVHCVLCDVQVLAGQTPQESTAGPPDAPGKGGLFNS